MSRLIIDSQPNLYIIFFFLYITISMAREKVVDILHVSVPGVIKGLVIRGLGGVRVMQY